MTGPDMLRAVISGAAGLAIGWTAQALQLGGRVDAIERGQARIEAMIVQMLTLQQAPHHATTPPPR